MCCKIFRNEIFLKILWLKSPFSVQNLVVFGIGKLNQTTEKIAFFKKFRLLLAQTSNGVVYVVYPVDDDCHGLVWVQIAQAFFKIDFYLQLQCLCHSDYKFDNSV